MRDGTHWYVRCTQYMDVSCIWHLTTPISVLYGRDLNIAKIQKRAKAIHTDLPAWSNTLDAIYTLLF